MAVVNTKSVSITNADATPRVPNDSWFDGAMDVRYTDWVAAGSSDSSLSVYRLVRLRSGDKVCSLKLSNDTNNTSGVVTVGLYETAANGGAAVIGALVSGTITAITKASPCVITAANTFVNGQSVYLSGIGGMTQLNGHSYIVSAVSATGFTITVDSTGFTTFTSGGTAALSPSLFTPDISVAVAAFYNKDLMFGATLVTQINKRIWELLGMTVDPFKEYDLCITMGIAGSVGSNMSLEAVVNR